MNQKLEAIKTQKSEKIVEHQNQFFHVYSQEVNFGSFSKKYYVTQHGTKACLLIVNGDSILLARQYRFLIDRPAWEVPGGKVEEGEEAGESAVRECEEETGIRGINVKSLLHYPQGLDCMSADAKLFYATEFKQVNKFTPNPAEVDAIQWFSLNDCMEMIKRGEILDHFSIIALLYYQHLNHSGKIQI